MWFFLQQFEMFWIFLACICLCLCANYTMFFFILLWVAVFTFCLGLYFVMFFFLCEEYLMRCSLIVKIWILNDKFCMCIFFWFYLRWSKFQCVCITFFLVSWPPENNSFKLKMYFIMENLNKNKQVKFNLENDIKKNSIV